jgi:hypothetical protein
MMRRFGRVSAAMALALLLSAACAGLPPALTGQEIRGMKPPAAEEAPAEKIDLSQRKDPPLDFPSDQGMECLAGKAVAKGGPGALVIKTAMARISGKNAYVGSCYSFAESVYVEAGFPAGMRAAAFSSKESGPYADPAAIRPGDWVSFTHVYSATVGHSAIFVSWLDFDLRSALTIDYPGNGRNEPARFRVADLYKVWGITRPR